MCCPRASSESATTGCSRRRPRLNAWHWRANCWPCRRPIPGPRRTHRPSCAGWPPSKSRAARIARSAVGASSRSCPPIVPHWRACSPHAAGRRERRRRHRHPLIEELASPRPAGTSLCPTRPRLLERTRAHSAPASATLRQRHLHRHEGSSCVLRGDSRCQPRRLKLTLPNRPSFRRLTSTRFIRRHAAPCLRQASSRRLINAVR